MLNRMHIAGMQCYRNGKAGAIVLTFEAETLFRGVGATKPWTYLPAVVATSHAKQTGGIMQHISVKEPGI